VLGEQAVESLRGARQINPMAPAPNEVRASDIVETYCANGQRVPCLTALDEYTRDCLAFEVASSMSSEHVVRMLRQLVDAFGTPKHLRTDNGSELAARRSQQPLRTHGIQ